MKKPCRSAWQQKWLQLDVTHSAIQIMADAAERFAASWFRQHSSGPTLLIFIGNSGSGKTHTARSILHWADAASMKAWEEGHWRNAVPSREFVSWPEITDGFKEGRYEILKDLFSADLLVIDDIGAEHDPSKNAADKLCQLLSRREGMFTVVTTNVQAQDWPEKFDVRIADRLLRRSKIVDVSAVLSYAVVSR